MRYTALFAGLLLAGATALSPGSARAEPCKATYTPQTMAEDLGNMTSAMRNLDESRFRAAGERLSQGLHCLGTPVRPPVYAATYRLLGAYEFIQGNEEEAARWFRTAIELNPSFEWDVRDFEVGHRIRVLYDDIKEGLVTEPVPVAGMRLLEPAGSELFIDGHPLQRAAATPNRPHLVQQVGADATIRRTWLIDGNALPAMLLEPEGGESQAVAGTEVSDGEEKRRRRRRSKETTVSAGSDIGAVELVKVDAYRPPLKTPLIVLGGVGVAGAGGVYAASWLARQEFDASSTTEEIESHRATTNTLVIASGALAAVSLGIGCYGVLLDGGFGFGIVRRF